MLLKLSCIFILKFVLCLAIATKPRLTLDEFFNATMYSTVSLSPDGEHLLVGTIHSSWNTSSYENDLYIYNIGQRRRKLVASHVHKSIKPQWSPDSCWVALLRDGDQRVYFYSVRSGDLSSVPVGEESILGFTWSGTASALYVAALNTSISKTIDDGDEWKDVIRYRQDNDQQRTAIVCVTITGYKQPPSFSQSRIVQLPFVAGELLHVPSQRKLLVTSVASIIERSEDFEIYSIDLGITGPSIRQLTNNGNMGHHLELAPDGLHVLFHLTSRGTVQRTSNATQGSLFALNIVNGQIIRLARQFRGNINDYTITANGRIYFVGQVGTEVQIYSQQFLCDDLRKHPGWRGTYESITVSSRHSLAFVHSSSEKPMEVYWIDHIAHLRFARAVTNENELFTKRDLPRATVYQWENADDHRRIEGLLHYPVGKYLSKNLPLLVMIHGGPFSASVNQFLPDWYTWAPYAASEGWLVLEPNYRGSTGYGDSFLQELRYQPLSLAGNDILYGVDQLVREGIADPHRLVIGGYSYGGFLTNWLITQTDRFNAALSGAGSADHVSAWGVMDLPILIAHLFGSYPWETPHIYQNESPLLRLDRVRTPTLITTGDTDVRVPTSQSYLLERALRDRNVPVKLLIFPKEGHSMVNDPWHGKIKIREELKWLNQYGNRSSAGARTR